MFYSTRLDFPGITYHCPRHVLVPNILVVKAGQKRYSQKQFAKHKYCMVIEIKYFPVEQTFARCKSSPTHSHINIFYGPRQTLLTFILCLLWVRQFAEIKKSEYVFSVLTPRQGRFFLRKSNHLFIEQSFPICGRVNCIYTHLFR